MGLKVVFDLSDADLKHFQLIMQDASQAASRAAPEDIVAAAEDLLQEVDPERVPAFIRERLEGLRCLITMITDVDWGLPDADRKRVLNALAYFCEPEDLIPDSIPGLGYLDDAIMIELAMRELAPEIEAYRDFCEFRSVETTRRGVKARTTDITREDWLADRRDKLQSRMRRRRRKAGAEGETRFRLFRD